MSRGLVVSLAVPLAVTGAVAGLLCGCDSPAALRDAPVDTPPDAPPDPPGVPDLQLVPDQMVGTVVITETRFDRGDCEIEEGCVGGGGMRRLLRFDTVTANLGTGDLSVGAPPPPGESNDVFEWSQCHLHHHFRGYTTYELVGDNGVMITARKQAFCIEDRAPMRPGAPRPRYSCLDQGLSRLWSDSYNRDTPCQWIDVTGVRSGRYTLRVVVNPEHTLPESNYDNNVFTLEVPI